MFCLIIFIYLFRVAFNGILKRNALPILRIIIGKYVEMLFKLKKEPLNSTDSGQSTRCMGNLIWCVINITWLRLVQFEWKIAKVIKLIIDNNLFIIIKCCKFTLRTRRIKWSNVERVIMMTEMKNDEWLIQWKMAYYQTQIKWVIYRAR